MTEIKLLNKIGKAGVDRFDGAKYTLSEDAAAPAGILVRSAAMHEMAFGPELLAIARAGAGVNNIPLDRCSEQGIVVFNTPGANANGVKELALAALLLSSRKIDAGIAWAKTLKGQEGVEKLVGVGIPGELDEIDEIGVPGQLRGKPFVGFLAELQDVEIAVGDVFQGDEHPGQRDLEFRIVAADGDVVGIDVFEIVVLVDARGEECAGQNR